MRKQGSLKLHNMFNNNFQNCLTYVKGIAKNVWTVRRVHLENGLALYPEALKLEPLGNKI